MKYKQQKNEFKSDVPFGVETYLQINNYMDSLYAVKKTVSKPTPRIKSNSILFIYICQGTGVMLSNHSLSSLQHGSIICLKPSDCYEMKPTNDSVLILYEVSISTGLYMYMIGNPYVRPYLISYSDYTLYSCIPKDKRALVESILSECAVNPCKDFMNEKMQLLRYMELNGLFTHYLRKRRKPDDCAVVHLSLEKEI